MDLRQQAQAIIDQGHTPSGHATWDWTQSTAQIRGGDALVDALRGLDCGKCAAQRAQQALWSVEEVMAQ